MRAQPAAEPQATGRDSRGKLPGLRKVLAIREQDLREAQAKVDEVRVLMFRESKAEGTSSVAAARSLGFSRSTFHRRYGL